MTTRIIISEVHETYDNEYIYISTPIWDKFIKATGHLHNDIMTTLSKYNATIIPSGSYRENAYLEFETEEDAVLFKLVYS